MFEKRYVYSGKFVLNILGCDQRLGVVETVRHKIRERDGGKVGGDGKEGRSL